jgi:dihydrofolate reductase
MRKIRIFEHMSLDGVIQSSGEDNFPYENWTTPYRTPAGLATLVEKYGERYDLLLGRRTYDIWSGFWPKAPSNPMADRLNAATKYVVTHRPESLEWGPVVGLGWVRGSALLRAALPREHSRSRARKRFRPASSSTRTRPLDLWCELTR